MEVTIKQVNRYDITIDGKVHEGFKRDSEWEGLLKFSGPAGVVIVHRQEDLSLAFIDIFGGHSKRGVGESPAEEFSVAKISPTLVPKQEKEKC